MIRQMVSATGAAVWFMLPYMGAVYLISEWAN